jgi:hypothetical protein
MHRSFKLHHRRQTGKLIHHRHTSYLALVLIIVSAGLCMLVTDSQARAATLAFTAATPAPLPSGAPVLTMPADGTEVTASDVHSEGICPVIDPAVVIALYDETSFLGSGICQTNGQFSIDATLTAGKHSLEAVVVSISGNRGAHSTPLTVSYVSPSKAAHSGTSTPLAILGDQQFIGFGSQSAAAWRGSFTGGNAPYRTVVDWGDGNVQTFKNVGTDQQSYIHAYGATRPYDVSITVTDDSGHTLTRHLAAVDIAPAPETDSIASLLTATGTPLAQQVLRISYLGLLVLSLWLWRYEVLTHRKVVAIPVYYGWQKARSAKKRAPLTK